MQEPGWSAFLLRTVGNQLLSVALQAAGLGCDILCPALQVTFSPDGRWIVSASFDKSGACVVGHDVIAHVENHVKYSLRHADHFMLQSSCGTA